MDVRDVDEIVYFHSYIVVNNDNEQKLEKKTIIGWI